MRRDFFRPALLVFLFLFLFLHVATAAATDWDPISPEEKQLDISPLDPGSGAVVLFKRGVIDVQPANASLWSTRIQTYTRIKILNESGREYANVVLESQKGVRFSKIEGRTILPSGEIIPLDTSKVFHGVAYKSGKDFAILTTSFTFSSVQPGAIIEYQIEEYSDWFYSPSWIFDTPGLATLQSSVRTIVNANMAMAQLPLSTTMNKVSREQKMTSFGLQTDYGVQYLLPIREEPYSVPYRDRAVMLFLNPMQVVFAGQTIPLITNWNDVAGEVSRLVGSMNKDNKEAPNKAREIAGKISDPRARAEAIYKYLQENITSTNLAGFFLDRKADEIITSKRADPDDINAVFVTMLKEVKVDADLELISTLNWQSLVKEFPGLNQFSRMIVRINLKDGPVYADASDASAPFGELPWFEKGVPGLVVKGGKVVEDQIPGGTPDDNTSLSKFNLQLSSDWKAEGDAEVDMKGEDAINFRSNLINEAPNKVQQNLSNYFELGHGDAEVSNIIHPDLQDTSKALDVKAHVVYPITEEAGPGEVLLNPWMGDAFRSPIFKAVKRQSFVHFESPEKRVTTSVWTLPLDIQVEKLPSDVNVQGDMADFSHSCTQSGATVTCTRTLTLKKTAMTDPRGYGAIKKFFDEVAQHDQEVVLLRKQ